MLENNKEDIKTTVNEIVEDKKSISETSESVENVEDIVAEETEKTDEKSTIPMLDYSVMDLEKLNKELQKILKKYPVQQIKANVDAIKNSFNSKFGTLLAEKKEAFLLEGGNSIDFQFSSPLKIEYNKLLSEYKVKKDTYYHQLEKQLKENLEKRIKVIDELKELIEKGDAKTMYANFKELQTRWKTIGSIPRTKYNDTWKIYHHHVERFYDLLHLNNDFRELDFKHNLEEKLKLIIRAENLLNKEYTNEIFKELQELHRLWKEEIGPVGREYREEIWLKFSKITKKINDKRHEYFRLLKSQHQEIIEKKLAIISEIEAYDVSNNKTYKDWQKSTKEIEVLRKKFFDSGKLPYSKSEAVWKKFKQATKEINQYKNTFYKSEKNVQNENLAKKKALIEIAESLKDSEDWETTSNTMKKIQADWKKIGHVPRKFSDSLWKHFTEACNHYFDRLNEQKNKLNEEQQIVVDTKKEFLEHLKTIENGTVEIIEERIHKWRELGKLPHNMRHLEKTFNKQIDVMLEKLSLNKEEIVMMKFKNIVDGYLAQEDYRKLDAEQSFAKRKIDETVREMQQLENNLSFISNATESNPFVKNVRSEINRYKETVDIWKSKLNYLKKLDY